MNRAQALLVEVEADIERLAEVTAWLDEARLRVIGLYDYIRRSVADDIAVVLKHDPAAVTPPVANEDAAWEAVAEFDLGMQRLLRIVTAQLTMSLDDTAR